MLRRLNHPSAFLQREAKKREIVIVETRDPIPVPPGRYRLAWEQGKGGSERNTLVEEIPVHGGSLVEVEI